MDINITVLGGRLAAKPEFTLFDSGTNLVKCLITVRTEEPRRRIDVIPVVLWNPNDLQTEELRDAERGDSVWVAGAVQRRFWGEEPGRTSRIEVVAHEIKVQTVPAKATI